LIVGLEIFVDNNIDRMLKVFLDLAFLVPGLLTERKVYDVLKIICASSNEKTRLKRYIKDIILEIDYLQQND
jgi:Cdc6-like AAA superfamily ATPase